MTEREMVEALAEEVRKLTQPLIERVAALEAKSGNEQTTREQVAAAGERITHLGERIDGVLDQVKDLSGLRERVTYLEQRDYRVQEFSVDLKEDGRTLAFKWGSGEHAKTLEVLCPWQIYRGIFKSGTSYVQGDTVTYGGSTYTALRHTTKSPGTSDWQLAVRRGSNA